MSGNPSSLGFLRYEAESSFGEDVVTFATRLPILDRVDVSSLSQAMIEPARVVQHMQGGTKKIPGPMGGAFKVKLHLTGHGSATSSGTSLTSLGTFLGLAVGGSEVAAASGTTATGGTAAVPTLTAATGFVAGSLARLGVAGDGRGGGEFVPVSTHSSNNLTLLLAAAVAPNNADVVHSAEMIYPKEIVGPSEESSCASLRVLLGTADLVYECHGVYPTGMSFGGLANGETPFVEIDFAVAWFRLNNSITFPVSTSVETFAPAISAGGSFVLGDVGATTRDARVIRNFEMSVSLPVVPLLGPGGLNQYQNIVGARRTPGDVKITITLDSDDDATDNEWLDWATNAAKQACYTLNKVEGGAVGLYFPNLVYSGNRPFQMDDGGLNRQKLEFQALAADSGSTNLARSAFRIALA